MRFRNYSDKIIVWGFYLLFFLVPIVFAGDTSELFEFNKMWVTFALTIVICSAWISKIIIDKQIRIQRTPFDIPIVLFLASQLVATFHSLDPYVSWWGYYSRFNGGTLSLISYFLLFYAFVSNLSKKQVIRVLQISLFSGLFVSLWGLPAHFGYDPTCFVFRGNFDVSCWTAAFQPKARIFSTLGQPDWLAAYLLLLLPIAVAFGINAVKRRNWISSSYYFLLTALFYADFLYTRSKGNFVAFAISFFIFLPAYFWISAKGFTKAKYFISIVISLILITFFIGTPFTQLDRLTFNGLRQIFYRTTSPNSHSSSTSTPSQPHANPITGEFGGTDSGKIRLFVWKGALDAWRHNLLFGTGVETFAFAYYLYRPPGHNLTSEWDYLYNKAHNEYLNYLATTGTFGITTYLIILGLFFFLAGKLLVLNTLAVAKNQELKAKFAVKTVSIDPVILLSLIISFLTIVISNFFGFSVVIVNIYLFIIPAMFYMLAGHLNINNAIVLPRKTNSEYKNVNVGQMLSIIVTWLIALYFLAVLINYWNADKAYGLGYNLDRAGQFQSAYAPLHQAVSAKPEEPVFQDELTVNDAALALGFAEQKDATSTGKLVYEAFQTSNSIVANHPNNIVFWKTRTRVMYTLSEIDPQYLSYALDAIIKSQKLAPTDAKVSYNLGLIYNQSNQPEKAINTLRTTINLKPDYRDAYYALATILHTQAVDKNGKVINTEKEDEAVHYMKYIIQTLSPEDKQAKDSLKSWNKQ